MIVTIHPSPVSGKVQAPASKSSMQRACAAALLSKGTTTILNPGSSNDDLAALDVIQKLGAYIISKTTHEIVIKSNGVAPVSSSINCGESGLGIRMFTPLAALSNTKLTINGTGSLLKRPMHFFDEIFPKLSIEISSDKGHLPINIKGPLKPSDISIDGSLSSQFLTGLLMAYAAAGAEGVTIRVNDLKSKPYIDLTLDVMNKFGVNIQHKNYEQFTFAKSSKFTAGTYTVEGDWSGGAFLLVAGAIAGKISVEGLSNSSTQADKKIMKALTDSGALLNKAGNVISVAPAALNAFTFDATDCPDLFPPLVALAAYCNGISYIKGVSRLAHKESNRGITLQEEFGKMGIIIELNGDIMQVHGGVQVKGATVHSHHDHRIAMACAVAALRAEGETIIEEAQAIEKSFPDFYQLSETLKVKSEK
ncbi:MAG TPA: 3-phosphoshikimate 1-carboxyvinyltransferase [Flavitalea sp.]|nr:3-phosphoshikimate 1-carboxyvinyltransferase [Flavitalea sp.]